MLTFVSLIGLNETECKKKIVMCLKPKQHTLINTLFENDLPKEGHFSFEAKA